MGDDDKPIRFRENDSYVKPCGYDMVQEELRSNVQVNGRAPTT